MYQHRGQEETMIALRDISFRHDPGSPIFESFSWDVAHGESWAVIGPSGAGKTSLLYLLAGLLLPQHGEIRIEGEPVYRPRPRTGLILQDYGLLPWLTVELNAALGLKVRNFYGPDGKHAPAGNQPPGDIQPWLQRLGIVHLASKYPSQISGGERQRTAICRTLALQPDLLLMDEPFSSLDAVTREDLQALTLDLCQEHGITLLIVTHSIEEAAVIGRKILVLGSPPNSDPVVINNPQAGQRGFRQSEACHTMCQMIRKAME